MPNGNLTVILPHTSLHVPLGGIARTMSEREWTRGREKKMRMRGHGVEEDDIGEGFGMRWCLRDTNRKYNNAGQLAIEI